MPSVLDYFRLNLNKVISGPKDQNYFGPFEPDLVVYCESKYIVKINNPWIDWFFRDKLDSIF